MSKKTEIENTIETIFNEITDRHTKSKRLLDNHFYGRGSWDNERQEFWIYLNPEDNFKGQFILVINWEISKYKIYSLKKQMKFYQEEN